MDRREFFKSGLQKLAKKSVEAVDEHISKRAKQWIRPPYAIDEIEFLLACTRCEDCIAACPYQVLFPLPLKYGADVVATPAMDLLNKACHLCDDWPCVNTCQANALVLTEHAEGEKLPLPKLAQARIDTERCIPYKGPECGACDFSCPVEGALVWDMGKPSINNDVCVGCAQCVESCITEPVSIRIFAN